MNQLASTLTTQLRAIAEVSTAVTQGDLTRAIEVEALHNVEFATYEAVKDPIKAAKKTN
jgi:hypothetical protein